MVILGQGHIQRHVESMIQLPFTHLTLLVIQGPHIYNFYVIYCDVFARAFGFGKIIPAVDVNSEWEREKQKYKNVTKQFPSVKRFRCVWLKSGLNAVGVPRIFFSYMSPCCISSETIVESFWREKKGFWKDKNFSHAEITFEWIISWILLWPLI
jgi:hypothetical protein